MAKQHPQKLSVAAEATGMTTGRQAEEDARLRPIREAMAAIDLDALHGRTVRDGRIQIRVTASEQASIKAAAEILGLPVSEYLLSLHEAMAERLAEDR
ncbi:MAG: DUF1778 domain-containing protein [Planctomycetota bacterium]|nr:MAG: DUF1778 domain-containing protein [Planctomycetota bacterium]